MTLTDTFNMFRGKLRYAFKGNSAGSTQALKNIGLSLAAGALWHIYGKPDVLLGPIPVYVVQRYEVAKSLDKLKYRAVAGQFFAHQQGGNVGFKVVLYLIGPKQLEYLAWLQLLHLSGQASTQLMQDISATQPIKSTAGALASQKSGSWVEIEKHFTFPILTKEEILYDMYIESMIYERDIAYGDAIKVTILGRKYIRAEAIREAENRSGVTLVEKEWKTQIGKKGTSSTVKDITINRTSTDAQIINFTTFATLYAHRAYQTRISDPYTDIEISRSIPARLDGTIYNLGGKPINKTQDVIAVNFNTFITDIKDAFTNEEVPSHSNSRLRVPFFNVSTNEEIKLASTSLAKFIRTINKDTNYSINVYLGGEIYYAKLRCDVTGLLKLSNLSRSRDIGFVGVSSGNCFVYAEDSKHGLLLFYANGDGTYDMYTYEGSLLNNVIPGGLIL